MEFQGEIAVTYTGGVLKPDERLDLPEGARVTVSVRDGAPTPEGRRAAALLKEIESQSPVLLWQVVCEFGAAMVRRKPRSEIKVGIPEMLDAWLGIYPLVLPSKQVVRTG